jgi:hypothetical protein
MTTTTTARDVATQALAETSAQLLSGSLPLPPDLGGWIWDANTDRGVRLIHAARQIVTPWAAPAEAHRLIAEARAAHLPPVPDDLPGWRWETSPAGTARLVMDSNGHATRWRQRLADPAIPIEEARQIVAAASRSASAATREEAPQLARASVRSLAVANIRRDGGTQARVGNNEETVESYAEAMRDGRWEWTPGNAVIVYVDDDWVYWLADGFHRVEAAQRAGRDTVLADIRRGARRDAVLYAAGANAAHGLRRTRQDVRRAIEVLLRDEEWVGWSDREIARHARCNHETVGTVRRELIASGGIRQIEDRTVSRGGTTYTQAPPARPAPDFDALPPPSPPATAALLPPARSDTFALDEIAAFARAALARLDCVAAAPLVEALPSGVVRANWRADVVEVRTFARAEAEGGLSRMGMLRIADQVADPELRESLRQRVLRGESAAAQEAKPTEPYVCPLCGEDATAPTNGEDMCDRCAAVRAPDAPATTAPVAPSAEPEPEADDLLGGYIEIEEDDEITVSILADGLTQHAADAIAMIADSLRLMARGEAHAVETGGLMQLAALLNRAECGHARGTLATVATLIAEDADALTLSQREAA